MYSSGGAGDGGGGDAFTDTFTCSVFSTDILFTIKKFFFWVGERKKTKYQFNKHLLVIK
jgi:hypothetical protein